MSTTTPTTRQGNWIATFTGTKFYLHDPRVEDVHIEDVAHALSLICRFGGHCSEFYSVAQHSLVVQSIVAEEFKDQHDLQLAALLHDATEAYIGDMVRPLKVSIPAYKIAEDRLAWIIQQALYPELPDNLDWQQIIKWADDVALMTERRDLINHRDYNWSIHAKPSDQTVIPMAAPVAETLFLAAFRKLTALAAEQ